MPQLQNRPLPGTQCPQEEKPPCAQRALLLEGERAFCKDLPELLKTEDGKWVAYRGEQRLGIADSSTHLYRECLAQGLDPKELFIEMIHPDAASNQFSFASPGGW